MTGVQTCALPIIMYDFNNCLPEWKELIGISFLKDESKREYLQLLEERVDRLRLS